MNPGYRRIAVIAAMLAAAITVSGYLHTIPSGPYQSNLTPTSAHSLGLKKVLIIRCHFPDLPANKTLAQVQAAMAGVKQRYLDYSYGKIDLDVTVTANDYLMPHESSYYTTRATPSDCWTALMWDASTLAQADYPVDPTTGGAYDFVGEYNPNIPKVAGAKIGGNYGSFGTKWFWINGAIDAGLVSHELGHALGSRHANLWKTSDGNPVSNTGKSVEYGDKYDVMAAAHQTKSDFNPWVKNHFGWIDDSQVLTATSSVTARIYRFDHPLASGLLAIKIPRGDGSNYWVSIRRKWTTVPNEMTGAYIIWGYNAVYHSSSLIDCNSPGADLSDSALQVGATLADAAHGISVTPLAIGGSSPSEWMDVQVRIQ